MKVIITESFLKDLSKIKDKKLAEKIEDVLRKLAKVNSLSEIAGIKKLKGSLTAYRIRIGDYRLGFYLNEGIIKATIFNHRKDIYKNFP